MRNAEPSVPQFMLAAGSCHVAAASRSRKPETYPTDRDASCTRQKLTSFGTGGRLDLREL
jgi:hypothetical protein